MSGRLAVMLAEAHARHVEAEARAGVLEGRVLELEAQAERYRARIAYLERHHEEDIDRIIKLGAELEEARFDIRILRRRRAAAASA